MQGWEASTFSRLFTSDFAKRGRKTNTKAPGANKRPRSQGLVDLEEREAKRQQAEEGAKRSELRKRSEGAQEESQAAQAEEGAKRSEGAQEA